MADQDNALLTAVLSAVRELCAEMRRDREEDRRHREEMQAHFQRSREEMLANLRQFWEMTTTAASSSHPPPHPDPGEPLAKNSPDVAAVAPPDISYAAIVEPTNQPPTRRQEAAMHSRQAPTSQGQVDLLILPPQASIQQAATYTHADVRPLGRSGRHVDQPTQIVGRSPRSVSPPHASIKPAMPGLRSVARSVLRNHQPRPPERLCDIF